MYVCGFFSRACVSDKIHKGIDISSRVSDYGIRHRMKKKGEGTM